MRWLWNIFKALPLGLGVPLVIGAASIGPEEAASNLSKWAHWFGLHDLPTWLLAKGTDRNAILGAIAFAIVYSTAVFIIPQIVRHQRSRPVSAVGTVAGASGSLPAPDARAEAPTVQFTHPPILPDASVSAPIAEGPVVPSPPATSDPSIPKVPAKPPRIFVDSHVTPESLMGLYEGNTTLRAETLISEQIGKWMPVSGPLGEIHPGRIFGTFPRTPTLVVFESNTKPTVYMWFSADWVERLASLPTNQNITVLGQIKKVTLYNTTVELENCELVDSDEVHHFRP